MVPARGVGAGARGHGASDVRRPLPLHLPGDLRGRAALRARAPAWPKVVGLASADLAAHGSRRPSCGRTAALRAPEQSLGCLWARQCSPGASPLRDPQNAECHCLGHPGAQRCRGTAPHRAAWAIGACGQPRHQGREARLGRRRADGGEAHSWLEVKGQPR